MTKDQFKQQARDMAIDGKMLEAGWIVNLRIGAPPEATVRELYEARRAFFFGARFMLEIMVDAQRVSDEAVQQITANLRKELEDFGKQLEAVSRGGALH